jgi:hypothetical protein
VSAEAKLETALDHAERIRKSLSITGIVDWFYLLNVDGCLIGFSVLHYQPYIVYLLWKETRTSCVLNDGETAIRLVGQHKAILLLVLHRKWAHRSIWFYSPLVDTSSGSDLQRYVRHRARYRSSGSFFQQCVPMRMIERLELLMLVALVWIASIRIQSIGK